jgi:hypothetical protein
MFGITLFLLCACEEHFIPDFEISARMLNKGDTLSIRERGLTFLRFAPHFLPGSVSFNRTYSNFRNDPPTIHPGAAYVFDKQLSLVYESDALAPIPQTF